jgi:hypothetical protein
MLRSVVAAGLSTCVVALAFSFSPSAHATWNDSATGQPVQVTPFGNSPVMQQAHPNQSTYGGHDLYWDKQCNTWRDSATGNEVQVTPFGNSPVMQQAHPNQSTYGGRNLYWQPCPPPIRTTNIRSNGSIHPFFALEGGGGWSNTNFAVAPPFGVSGSSFVGGINGGVLIDIPGTIFSVGPRIGWQGGNMSGSISGPAASPFFDYNVSTTSIFYQEVRISSSGLFPDAGFLGDSIRGRNITPSVSVGVAEVQTKFTGTSGAFQVTDTVTQTGFTGTVGIGFPISPAFLGGELDAYAQYRVIALPTATVSIPGQVQINNFWAQGITFGLEFRY